ncbi:MAG: lysophospholipase [Clostridiales Family XIII bacterium]|jgi:alpha-beta hydrolase superfamily lysophospholipase|nr:lysophospholipase [Clostridiales Family XIII bacterium]
MDTGNDKHEKFELVTKSAGIIAGYTWAASNETKKGIVCIIIHGIMVSAKAYSNVAEPMADAGIDVISMDLPGHGESPGSRWDIGPRDRVFFLIDALLGEARRRFPNEKIAIFAHSIGGNIALDYRVNGTLFDLPYLYVIAAPWLTLSVPIPFWIIPPARLLAKSRPSFVISQKMKANEVADKLPDVPVNRKGQVKVGISARAGVEGWDAANRLLSHAEEPNSLSPALIMHGTNDDLCSIDGSRYFAALNVNSNVTLVEFEGYPHDLHDGTDGTDGTLPIRLAIDKMLEE